MKNKLTTAVLSATMIVGTLGAAGTSFAATTPVNTDGAAPWATDAINQLIGKGILSGDQNGNFDPKGQLTRAQFVKMMVLSMGLPVDTTITKSATFTDAPDWAAGYIDAAFNAGLIHGTGAHTFSPSAPITREQSAVIMVNALIAVGAIPADEVATLTFTDKNSIAPWAQNAVAIAFKNGLIKGNPDGSFDPKGQASREQAAVMASNFIESSDKLVPPDKNDLTPPKEDPTPPVVTPPTGGSGSTGSGGSGGSGGTTDMTAPNAPTALAPSNVAQTTLTLTWTASTTTGVTGYEVYQGTTKLATVTGTTYNVTGLTANTNYSFTVKAVGANTVVSAASTPTTITTLAAPVVDKTNLTIIGGDSGAGVGRPFYVNVNISGHVAAADQTKMVRLYATIDSELSASDVSIAASDSGTPEVVHDYVAGTSNLEYVWGPSGGFPLSEVSAYYESDGGLSSSFLTTITKAGIYHVTYQMRDMDGNVIAESTRSSTLTAANPISQLTISANNISATTGQTFNLNVNVKGDVNDLDRARKVKYIVSVMGGLTSDDVTAISADGQPLKVWSDGKDGAPLAFEWGPEDGFPLGSLESQFESEDGLTGTFHITINKPGTYQVNYLLEELTTDLLAGMTYNTITVVDPPVVVNRPLAISLNLPTTATTGQSFAASGNIGGTIPESLLNTPARYVVSVMNSNGAAVSASDVSITSTDGQSLDVLASFGNTLLLAWGPREGFPLNVIKDQVATAQGLTTGFNVTINKPGTYQVAVSLATSTNPIVVQSTLKTVTVSVSAD